MALQWRHNGHDGVLNHQPHDCLINRLFGRKSKKTSKLLVTGLCAGNSRVTGEFPAQMASNAENVSIWWRHHGYIILPEYYLSYTDINGCLIHDLFVHSVFYNVIDQKCHNKWKQYYNLIKSNKITYIVYICTCHIISYGIIYHHIWKLRQYIFLYDNITH